MEVLGIRIAAKTNPFPLAWPGRNGIPISLWDFTCIFHTFRFGAPIFYRLSASWRPQSRLQVGAPECWHFVRGMKYAGTGAPRLQGSLRGERRKAHLIHRLQTMIKASQTMLPDILEQPWNRSVNTIGTSATRMPLIQMRWVISI